MKKVEYVVALGMALVTAIACGEPTHADAWAKVTAAGPASALGERDGSAEQGVTYVPYEGGSPVTGRIGADGGTLSRLLFAVVGDTRPALEDDTAGYPTEVIATIYGAIEAIQPRPPMVLSTGDYMFASTPSRSKSQAAAQLELYLQARSRFSGVLFPAIGNHECTGATSSNCGPGADSGVTANYASFCRQMLGPIGESQPYYVIEVDGRGSVRPWTAKFVFVAANAWSSTQEAWLQATLAHPSTYTFVIRHEPASATTAPGVVPSERVMARYPYTLAIVGHSHTYAHDRETPREVLIGNGGAPLGAKDYGFGIFSQRDDGAIVVDMINWRSGEADAAFHFAVTADGGLVP